MALGSCQGSAPGCPSRTTRSGGRLNAVGVADGYLPSPNTSTVDSSSTNFSMTDLLPNKATDHHEVDQHFNDTGR